MSPRDQDHKAKEKQLPLGLRESSTLSLSTTQVRYRSYEAFPLLYKLWLGTAEESDQQEAAQEKAAAESDQNVTDEPIRENMNSTQIDN